MKHFRIVVIILAGLFVVSGCEDEKADKLNQAQTCLDKADANAFADAAKCLDYLDGISGAQASLLRCSISLFSGGITTVRIANAFKQIDTNGGGAANEAYLITAMAMSTTAAADEAYSYCANSGIASLKYISSLAVVGTQLASAGGFLSDIISGGSDYVPDVSDVTAGLSGCTSSACQEAIGSAILPIADSYCSGGSADQAACDDINAAVDNAGGNPERVGELLICLMQDPPVAPASCP